MREIKSSPAFFDADDLVVTQHFAASADGTQVPYFLVAHRDSTEPGPTLLEGYGAFRVAKLPGYLGLAGRLWLAVAVTTLWRTPAVARNMGRPGTTRRYVPTGTR